MAFDPSADNSAIALGNTGGNFVGTGGNLADTGGANTGGANTGGNVAKPSSFGIA